MVCLGCSGEGNDSAACSVPNHGPCPPGQSHPKEQHWRAAAGMKKQRICRAASCKCAKAVTSFIKEKQRQYVYPVQVLSSRIYTVQTFH